MREPASLPADLLSSYRDSGFVVIENVFSESELASISDSAARIVNAFDADRHRSVFSTLHRDRDRDRYFVDSAEAIHCFLEEAAVDDQGKLLRPKSRAINKIGHALHDLDPAFRHFCRLPVISEVLKALEYRAPQLWQTMYIFKQPDIGGEVRWHQDASYLISEPASVIGLWVAVEDAHRDNGCLWMQPGGHHSPLRDLYVYDHETGQGELREVGTAPWPHQDEAIAVEVPAGSLVAFHGHMPHYSSQNHSQHSRQAFSMHFAEADSAWSESNWLQRCRLKPWMV
ncbi:MAG TPA: phytanoyl-CoA dioxygenase family protein [Xanthomonadales bacterium]|nr:phytanoyl-CoA dioxygenase family protein [Xanthomonadales bacterium]